MRALLLLDAADEADMRKKDGGSYGAKSEYRTCLFFPAVLPNALGRQMNMKIFYL